MNKNKKNLRLTSVSAGAETVMHIILGLFALCCIIPFIFVIIISFQQHPPGVEPGNVPVRL